MRFRNKLLLMWGALALLLWGGAWWPVQHAIDSTFRHLTDNGFRETRGSLNGLLDQRNDAMRQACRLVGTIPELRALIAESGVELSDDDKSSLQQRLDDLAPTVGVDFLCVMNNRGQVIAQNRNSPWKTVARLGDYLAASPQAMPLVHRVLGASTAAETCGLWKFDRRLFQVVAMPMVFQSEDGSASGRSDGVLFMGVALSDTVARQLASSHDFQVSFLVDGAVGASSVPAAQRASLIQWSGQHPRGSTDPFDLVISGTRYRGVSEPLLDPCSSTQVGNMLVQSSETDGMALRSQAARDLMIIGIVGLIVSALISYVLGAAITRPVNTLLDGVRRVGAGDLDVSLPSRGRDELHQLAGAFNEMVGQLRTRRELKQLVEQSQAASRAKSQFLANMSHEIRTPLNGVVGMAELLLGTELDDRQRRYASLVRSSAEVLGSLINDILDFSKIEAGKLELENIEFDLHATVEDVLELLAQKALARDLDLAGELRPDVPRLVVGDPVRIRQILINLVNNAIKFTDRGSVTIGLTLAGSAISGQLTLRLAVRDTGIGIPADRLDRLFKSFSQVDASTTRKYGGTGLGLAITRQLAELMGGQIGVESTVGVGSEFWVTARLQSAPASSVGVAIPHALRNARIAIITTLPASGPAWVAQLKRIGVAAILVQTAQGVIDAIGPTSTAADPRLILVDSMLPQDIAGEVTRRARALDDPAAKLILVTPLGSELSEVDLQSAGWAAQISRPVRTDALRDALTDAASGQKSRAPIVRAPTRATRRQPARLLLAEDNEVNQLVARDILTNAGFTCDVVGDGEQAAAAAARSDYHLILMDCQMPRMDGVQATRAIREEEQRRGRSRVPIIALTANASGADRGECRDAGMDGYCPKPFAPQQLIDTIEAHLRDDRPLRAANDPSPAAAFSGNPAAEESPAAGPPINSAQLLELCRGKTSLLQSVLDKFAAQSAAAIEQARESLECANAVELARVSHSLKGMAGLISAGRLREISARMEKLGRDKELADAATCMVQLRDEIQRCLDYLPEVAAFARSVESVEGVTP